MKKPPNLGKQTGGTVTHQSLEEQESNMINSLAPTAAPVNAAPPAVAPAMHIPYLWGVEDAQAGRPCVPEMLWANRAQQVFYCKGYEKITGPTMTTRQILWGK